MKDSVRALAAELKEFLRTREEDDLMPAAQKAAAHASAPHTTAAAPAAQDHLTIEFARTAKPAAAAPVPVQPPPQPPPRRPL